MCLVVFIHSNKVEFCCDVGKGKDQYFKFGDGVKVIEDAANGLSQRKLSEKYKCSKTQIQKLLKDKDAIKEKLFKNANKNQKCETYQPFKEINELTLAWFEGAHARKIPISGPILQEKAVFFFFCTGIKN